MKLRERPNERAMEARKANDWQVRLKSQEREIPNEQTKVYRSTGRNRGSLLRGEPEKWHERGCLQLNRQRHDIPGGGFS